MKKRCLKCKAYKLAGVGFMMDVIGFPGFEFIPAMREMEKRAQHILNNFKRKKK